LTIDAPLLPPECCSGRHDSRPNEICSSIGRASVVAGPVPSSPGRAGGCGGPVSAPVRCGAGGHREVRLPALALLGDNAAMRHAGRLAALVALLTLALPSPLLAAI